ncbi:hypothetical protein [Streptomyces hyaluromycini]|uniref:hypothetical protein n=1 Tax=Streptomyces hyaluromycini TaxID=1377993 RepID=UPI001237CD08
MRWPGCGSSTSRTYDGSGSCSATRLAAGRARHARVAAFRLLDARGGLVRLRAAVALLDDPDVKLRGWAERSVRQWHPTPDVPLGSEEAAALPARAGLSLCRY